jgi:ABC-type polysaccharide/polyol phosphate transport system ATPase subunit
MAGRELGDLNLSGLMMAAIELSEPTFKLLAERFEKEVSDTSTINQAIDVILKKYSAGMQSNLGNKLTLDEWDPEIVTGDWLYKEPPK